mgnify:CR=1 FL=1
MLWYVYDFFLGREEAIQMGQMLISKHFGNEVSGASEFKTDGTLYQLLEDNETEALNSGKVSDCEPRKGECKIMLISVLFNRMCTCAYLDMKYFDSAPLF